MIIRKSMGLQTIGEELAAYEAEYSLPSDRLQEAFRTPQGALVESDLFYRWQSLYAVWLRLSNERRSVLV